VPGIAAGWKLSAEARPDPGPVSSIPRADRERPAPRPGAKAKVNPTAVPLVPVLVDQLVERDPRAKKPPADFIRRSVPGTHEVDCQPKLMA
jgi:hypothetical protein